MTPSRRFTLLPLGLTLVILALVPTVAFAHCDSMDGPVVKAAMAALEQGNANLMLIWVKEEYEAEVRGAFERTLVVRQLGGEAKALADRYFLETVVRLHRMGGGHVPACLQFILDDKITALAATAELEVTRKQPHPEAFYDHACKVLSQVGPDR